jgi:hypothetical protein
MVDGSWGQLDWDRQLFLECDLAHLFPYLNLILTVIGVFIMLPSSFGKLW